MDRRSFLRKLGIGAAGSAALAATQLPGLDYDPEHALWTPGRKAIFIPATSVAKLETALDPLQPIAMDQPVLEMQRYGMSDVLYIVRNDKTNWQERRFVGGVPEEYISQHGDVTRWHMSYAEPVGESTLPELFSETAEGKARAKAEEAYWRRPFNHERLASIRAEFKYKGIYNISTDSWDRADGTSRSVSGDIVGRWRK